MPTRRPMRQELRGVWVYFIANGLQQAHILSTLQIYGKTGV
jgi:hypothetical protein